MRVECGNGALGEAGEAAQPCLKGLREAPKEVMLKLGLERGTEPSWRGSVV